MPLSLNSALDDLRLSGIRRFSALAAQTPGCVSLTLGEPGEGTPAAVCAQVGIDLDHGLTHYPPNNGFAWLREAICAWEAERGVALPPGNVIVTDGATEALYPELADRTIVANSFSKPWAMTGWRLGWVGAGEKAAAAMAKVHQYVVSSVPAFLQHATVEALATNTVPMSASYQARRDITGAALERMGLPVVTPRERSTRFPASRGSGVSPGLWGPSEARRPSPRAPS